MPLGTSPSLAGPKGPLPFLPYFLHTLTPPIAPSHPTPPVPPFRSLGVPRGACVFIPLSPGGEGGGTRAPRGRTGPGKERASGGSGRVRVDRAAPRVLKNPGGRRRERGPTPCAVGRVLMHHPGEEGGLRARPEPVRVLVGPPSADYAWSTAGRSDPPGVCRAPLAPLMASVPPCGRSGRRGAEAVAAKPGLGRPPPWSEGGGLSARGVARGGPASAFVPRGSAHGIGGVGGGTRTHPPHPRHHSAEGRPPAGPLLRGPGSGLAAVGAPPRPAGGARRGIPPGSPRRGG